MLKAILIIQGCFHYWWAGLMQVWGSAFWRTGSLSLWGSLRTFLLPTTPLQRVGWGEQTVERGHTSWPKGYSTSYDVVFNNKSSGRGRGGKGICGVLAFFFPGNCHKWWGPALQEMNSSLPVGSIELNPYFALPSCATFALFIKLSLCQTTSFHPFIYLSILFSTPLKREWVSSYVWFSCL